MKTKFQKEAIKLNGINEYINWKNQVVNDFNFDENGNKYPIVHKNAEIYISETFGKFDGVKWDNN